MREKRRISISEKDLRQIAKGLPERQWKMSKFLHTLALTWSVDFDLLNDKLIISTSLVKRDGETIEIGRERFVECIKAETFSKLDFVLFLRRSDIAVNIVNHGRTTEDITAVMENINTLARIGLL